MKDASNGKLEGHHFHIESEGKNMIVQNRCLNRIDLLQWFQ